LQKETGTDVQKYENIIYELTNKSILDDQLIETLKSRLSIDEELEQQGDMLTKQNQQLLQQQDELLQLNQKMKEILETSNKTREQLENRLEFYELKIAEDNQLIEQYSNLLNQKDDELSKIPEIEQKLNE